MIHNTFVAPMRNKKVSKYYTLKVFISGRMCYVYCPMPKRVWAVNIVHSYSLHIFHFTIIDQYKEIWVQSKEIRFLYIWVSMWASVVARISVLNTQYSRAGYEIDIEYLWSLEPHAILRPWTSFAVVGLTMI